MTDQKQNAKRALVRKRSRARRLAMQGLYQWQMTGQDVRNIMSQLREKDEYRDVDPDYFRDLMKSVIAKSDDLDALISESIDRPLDQIDPVERAIIWCGLVELTSRPDIPAGVAINEAVELAKRFGAQDSYKYVNAILDAAAANVRGK